jgi:hypothetical protein
MNEKAGEPVSYVDYTRGSRQRVGREVLLFTNAMSKEPTMKK